MDEVDFSGGWDTFWGAIKEQIGGVADLLTIIGMLMVLGSIIGWIWKKKRSGGQVTEGLGGVLIVLFIGCVFAAPGAIIPAILSLVDYAGNAVVALVQRFGES